MVVTAEQTTLSLILPHKRDNDAERGVYCRLSVSATRQREALNAKKTIFYTRQSKKAT